MVKIFNTLVVNFVIFPHWFVFFTLIQKYDWVVPLAVFETNILSLNNSRNMIATSKCCGSTASSLVCCPSQCQTYFEVCLDDVHLTEPNCRFGEAHSSNFAKSSLNFNMTCPKRKLIIVSHSAWPGEFGIRITVRDNSSSHHIPKGHIIQSVSVTGNKMPNLMWHSFNATGSVSVLQFLYQIRCGTYYYGRNCTSYCKERDDQHGHYRCDSEGRRICLDGWIEPDSYCKKAVCDPACTNGLCISPNKCSCHDGWTGNTCSICITRIGCQNGTCTVPGGCSCDKGWGGINCDRELDYCGMRVPCQNSGTCINRPAPMKFMCFCMLGYTGKKCESKITACTSSPCQNGASCSATSVGFTCNCTNEYTGERCETFVDICSRIMCKNNGTCSVVDGSAMCHCTHPYTGKHCAQRIIYPSYTLQVLGSTLVKNYTEISESYSKTKLHQTSPISELPSIESVLKYTLSSHKKITVGTTDYKAKTGQSEYFHLTSSNVLRMSVLQTSESTKMDTGPTWQKETEKSTRLQTKLYTPYSSSVPKIISVIQSERSYDYKKESLSSDIKFISRSKFDKNIYTQSKMLPSSVTSVVASQNPYNTSGNIGRKYKRGSSSDQSLAIAISASLSIVIMILIALILLWRKTIQKRSRRLRMSSITPSSISFQKDFLDPGEIKYNTFIDAKNHSHNKMEKNQEHKEEVAKKNSSNMDHSVYNSQIAANADCSKYSALANRKRTKNTIDRSRHPHENIRSSPESKIDLTDTNSRHESVSSGMEDQSVLGPVDAENRHKNRRKDSNVNFDGFINYGYLSEGTSGYSSSCSSPRSSANYHQTTFKSLVNASDIHVLPMRHSQDEAVEDLPNCIVYKEEQL